MSPTRASIVPVVERLRSLSFDVLAIAELEPGIQDEDVLLRSNQAKAVLLTADKDFGELVFRQRLPAQESTRTAAVTGQ